MKQKYPEPGEGVRGLISGKAYAAGTCLFVL